MKYLKGTIIVFIFTTLLSTVLVSAATKGIAGLTIPAFQGEAETSKQVKEDFGTQRFSLVKCEESITGNETAVKARTFRVNYTDNSSWTQLVKGSLIDIAPEHTEPTTYTLKIKSVNYNLLSSSLYGTWALG